MLATREQMFDHGQPSYAEVNHDVIKALTTTTWRYWVTLGISAGTALLFFMAPWDVPDHGRRGRRGHEPQRHVGHLSVQLHILDRLEPFRNAAVRRAAHYPVGLAQVDLPQRRGHDPVFAHDGGHVRNGARGTGLVRALDLPDSQSDGAVAELPLAADVRRDGRRDLSHRQQRIHLHGFAAGFRRGAGRFHRPAAAHLRDPVLRLARDRP